MAALGLGSFPLLCSGDRCQPSDPQAKPWFFDGDHLTAHANPMLAPDLLRMLQAAAAGAC